MSCIPIARINRPVCPVQSIVKTAIVAENDYQADQTVRFLDKIFEGDTKGLVATLIKKDLLSTSDYEELNKYWKDGEKMG